MKDDLVKARVDSRDKRTASEALAGYGSGLSTLVSGTLRQFAQGNDVERLMMLAMQRGDPGKARMREAMSVIKAMDESYRANGLDHPQTQAQREQLKAILETWAGVKPSSIQQA
ncbi:hypothetical protein [Oleiagrimonas sp. C23AA]|uniref:hypothetical protein n=1 Tax=Oleiagrimonas sp. C23AA TaxID=2719047 RepID=UPI001420CBDA|nr:hypothetical protein [Oleiagrimonas sp. C23AA]NII09698.1 hypothetical protein [Oleiagrimonas sp. C23AA]